MALNINSRYLLTNLIAVVDPKTGELTKPVFVDLRQRVSAKASDDKQVSADASLYWDSLALSKLGDARHWWVIADLSSVVDPFEEYVAGAPLRVPSVRRFLFDISSPEQT